MSDAGAEMYCSCSCRGQDRGDGCKSDGDQGQMRDASVSLQAQILMMHAAYRICWGLCTCSWPGMGDATGEDGGTVETWPATVQASEINSSASAVTVCPTPTFTELKNK